MATIVIPKDQWPGDLLNINSMRKHHQKVGAMVRPWRELGWALVKEQRLTTFTRPVTIWCRVRFPDNRRRDSGNLFPTFKALIDGFVDAKLLVDDCDGIVSGPWIDREYPNGPAQITIEIEVKV